MRVPVRAVILVGAALLPAAAGCGARGDPHGRVALAGTVTFRGAPLDAGTVEFLPPDPNNGFSTRALVRDGRYKIPRDQGLPPGTYRVLVTSPEPSKDEGPAGPPGMKMPPLGKERIPAAYNRDSRVTVEVTAGRANTFDFTIP